MQMVEIKKMGEVMRILGYAIGVLKGVEMQTSGEMNFRLKEAINHIENVTNKLMKEIEKT